MQTHTPFQYSKYGNIIKSFLHTKIGAKLGFYFAVKGFNRVGAIHTSAKTGKETFIGFAYNSRVDKGGDLIASLITGAAQNSISSPLPPKYVALSTSTLSPAHTDTTLTGETSLSGLGRALGTQGSYVTPTTLDGAASYTVTKTFTAGAAATIVSAALFDAVSTGNMFVEANLAANAIMAIGDTIAITWTVNL